jgi:hypothetical protein
MGVLFMGCESPINPEPDDPTYPIYNYDSAKDPIENISVLFSQAKFLSSENVRFYLLSGFQKSKTPQASMDLNWNCYFSDGNTMLDFDISALTVTKKSSDSLPHGYSLLSEPEVTSLFSIEQIWNKCIAENSLNLLNCNIYRPLIWPVLTNLNFFGYSKEGQCLYNIDFFVYNMNTGMKIP